MAERQRRLQYPSYISLRMKLLWTRNFPTPFRSLSLNVSREIGGYYGILPDVIVESDKGLWAFKVGTRTWEHLLAERRTYRGFVASAFLGEGKLFLVLTANVPGIEESPFYAIWNRGRLTSYGVAMDRNSCAVTFDRVRNCVYIFGGERNAYQRDLNQSCDKFPLKSCRPEYLPDMLIGRCNFGLCLHQSLLYICGGSHCSVHTFSPVSLIHSSLCDLSSTGIGHQKCLAASDDKEIVIMTAECILRGDGQKWKVKSRKSGFGTDMDPIYSPVLVGSVFFYSQFRRCFACNIDTAVTNPYTMPRARNFIRF